MLVSLLVFIISIAVLIKSSDIFTDEAEIIGKGIGIPSFIVGVTIVAVGTSMPELASSIMSVYNNNSEIVLSNVIGSNIANILLILGISLLFLKTETRIRWDMFHAEISFLAASTILIGVMMWDGFFSLGEALIFMIMYLIYLWYNLDVHKSKNKKIVVSTRKISHSDISLIIISVILIAISADYTVKSAVELSRALNIGVEFIGLTAIAVGTSLPELVVSAMAARKNNIELAIGNVTGSNIFNAFMVASIPRFLGAVAVPEILISVSFPFLVISTIMLFTVILDRRVHRFEGAILLLMYVIFILETFL
ncbi:MAG: calcium/sodium antiporter [Candidatus Micrarchaeia archaeon]